MIRIYFARPITGCTPDQVLEYYTDMGKTFTDLGADILQPMVGKSTLCCELKKKGDDVKFKSTGYKATPCSSNHAILQRDLWMVEQSDIVFVDFTDCEQVSIGCCMELAVGHWLRKHTVIVLPKNSLHNHAFVLEAADIIFDNHAEAMEYLEKLIKSITGGVI